MGLTKTAEFTKTQNDLALLTKALGHPARVAILQFLIEKKSCICGDIVDELPLSQSTVSQHLRELKNAGLIKGEIEGPSVCYCIDVKAWNNAKKVLGTFFESYNDINCC
jgi:DNA-binding transcriptional ArsR family regulator